MPRVWLDCDTQRVPDYLVEDLQAMLRHAVAKELSCRDFDGSLTSRDLEVKVEAFGPHDFNGKYGITVTILANDFPDRRVDLDARREQISRRLRAFLDDHGLTEVTGCIYIALVPASFGEF